MLSFWTRQANSSLMWGFQHLNCGCWSNVAPIIINLPHFNCFITTVIQVKIACVITLPILPPSVHPIARSPRLPSRFGLCGIGPLQPPYALLFLARLIDKKFRACTFWEWPLFRRIYRIHNGFKWPRESLNLTNSLALLRFLERAVFYSYSHLYTL